MSQKFQQFRELCEENLVSTSRNDIVNLYLTESTYTVNWSSIAVTWGELDTVYNWLQLIWTCFEIDELYTVIELN